MITLAKTCISITCGSDVTDQQCNAVCDALDDIDFESIIRQKIEERLKDVSPIPGLKIEVSEN